MKVMLIDVINGKIEELDIEDELETYYKLIQCDIIDIVVRTIGNRSYNIVCDDEGLLTDNVMVSAINSNRELMLVGNLVICGDADANGELQGITEEDVENIKENIVTAAFRNRDGVGYIRNVLVCEY